jgi:hypothetical protein
MQGEQAADVCTPLTWMIDESPEAHASLDYIRLDYAPLRSAPLERKRAAWHPHVKLRLVSKFPSRNLPQKIVGISSSKSISFSSIALSISFCSNIIFYD